MDNGINVVNLVKLGTRIHFDLMANVICLLAKMANWLGKHEH